MRVESSSQGDDCIEVGHDKSKKTSCFKGRLGQKCSVESVTVLVSRKSSFIQPILWCTNHRLLLCNVVVQCWGIITPLGENSPKILLVSILPVAYVTPSWSYGDKP
jgi:hypothetical protein